MADQLLSDADVGLATPVKPPVKLLSDADVGLASNKLLSDADVGLTTQQAAPAAQAQVPPSPAPVSAAATGGMAAASPPAVVDPSAAGGPLHDMQRPMPQQLPPQPGQASQPMQKPVQPQVTGDPLVDERIRAGLVDPLHDVQRPLPKQQADVFGTNYLKDFAQQVADVTEGPRKEIVQSLSDAWSKIAAPKNGWLSGYTDAEKARNRDALKDVGVAGLSTVDFAASVPPALVSGVARATGMSEANANSAARDARMLEDVFLPEMFGSETAAIARANRMRAAELRPVEGAGTPKMPVATPPEFGTKPPEGAPSAEQLMEQPATARGPETAIPVQADYADQRWQALKEKGKELSERLNQVVGEPQKPVARLPVDPRDAEALISSRIGAAERETAITNAELEPFMAQFNALSKDEQLQFYADYQNRSKNEPIGYVDGKPIYPGVKNPALQPLADTLRKGYALREEKLRNLNSTAEMNFITDYLPQMVKDPKKGEEFIANWVGGKQGSGTSLKKRKYPTIADMMAAGLELKYPNALEAASVYNANMDRFIAINSVFEEARAAQEIKYVSPGNQPEGWVPLNGRLGEKMTPAGKKLAYAPPEWANKYNNFISTSLQGVSPGVRNAVDNIQAATNSVTALELGLSAYHAATMAQEAMANDIARAVNEAFSGMPLKAGASLVSSPVAPIRLAMIGKKAKNIYLGKTIGTEADKEIIDLLTNTNAKMTGMDKTLRSSAMGSLFTAWKRGALRIQALEEASKFKNAPTPLKKTASAIGTISRTMGRVMDTVAQPLFEQYIPLLKNGAAYDNLKSWIAANPKATQSEKLLAAKKIWDSIDNRFGEVVQDRLFMDATLKQALQIGLRSYSWKLGTIREIAGGVYKGITKPQSLSMRSKDFDPRSAYVLALPITWAIWSSVYQKVKTGKNPEGLRDLVQPQTGGTNPDGSPERLNPIGYMRDVLGWATHPYEEAVNSINTGLRVPKELASSLDYGGGEDALGLPIRNPSPDAGMVEIIKNYFDYLARNLGPISVRNLMEGGKEGSNVSLVERFMGASPAGKQSIFEGPSPGAQRYYEKKWNAEKRLYGGTGQ